jgi:hypothetical protein
MTTQLRLVVNTDHHRYGDIEWHVNQYFLQAKIEDKWRTFDLVQYQTLSDSEKSELQDWSLRMFKEGKIGAPR